VNKNPSKNHRPDLGIIEGFFGRSWSWQDRQAYAKFLALNEFDFFIYAPKNDIYLRKQWFSDWPPIIKQQLMQLRETYREVGVQFGVGLSPHEIYLNDSADKRKELVQRVQHINQLEPEMLCLLFDDMRGDMPGIADIQVDLMHQVAAASNARRIIFCPTYYSFDPVLEKVFGTMPENYWQVLRTKLDSNIDIFWTGEKVCSTNYPPTHLDHVNELLGRKVFLWDNYPVNDGAVKSNFLHLRAFPDSHGLIQGRVAGHAINPMNQPWLSQLALASLPHAYDLGKNYDSEKATQDILTSMCGELLASHLLQDIALLQDKGLKNMSDEEKIYLLKRYQPLAQNPLCAEVVEWLQGGYTFDPACLTE
jgi:hyaluronoglucosaminidase